MAGPASLSGLGYPAKQEGGLEETVFLRFLRAGAFQGRSASLVLQLPHRWAGIHLLSPNYWQFLSDCLTGGRLSGVRNTDAFSRRVPSIYLAINSNYSLQREGPSPARWPKAVPEARAPLAGLQPPAVPRWPFPRGAGCRRLGRQRRSSAAPGRGSGTPRRLFLLPQSARAPRSGSGGPLRLQRDFRVIFKRRVGGGLREVGLIFPAFYCRYEWIKFPCQVWEG